MRTLTLAVLVGLAISLLPAGAASAQAPPPYGPPITLEQAKKAAAAAEAEARKNNWSHVIVILDSGGNLVLLERMDNTQLGGAEVARQKAYSAVAFRRPTKVFQDRLAGGGIGLQVLGLEGAVPLEGGFPIVADGKIIGGIGASGGSAEQDAQVASAGLAALK